MMSRFLLLFLIIFPFLSFAQETEIVKIRKTDYTFYRCIRADASDWFFATDDSGMCYLFHVVLQNADVEAWLKRFGNSQNIYKAGMQHDRLILLDFRKENDPSDYLSFYLDNSNSDYVVLTALTDSQQFKFQKIVLF